MPLLENLALGAQTAANAGELASGINGIWNFNRTFKAQQKNIKINREREDNAVQRRVADLKAAGLHPTLAAGSPASAAPQSSTVGTPPPLPNPDFTGSVRDSAASANLRAQNDNLHEQNQLLRAQTLQANQSAFASMEEQDRADAYLELDKRRRYGEFVGEYDSHLAAEKQRALLDENITSKQLQNTFDRVRNIIQSTYGLPAANVAYITSQLEQRLLKKRDNIASEEMLQAEIATELSQISRTQSKQDAAWYTVDKITDMAKLLTPILGAAILKGKGAPPIHHSPQYQKGYDSYNPKNFKK